MNFIDPPLCYWVCQLIQFWKTPGLLGAIDTCTLKGKRDFALLAVLLGCGLRRAELIAIKVGDFEQRDGHWLLPDMLGKGGHIRTVPVPGWVKAAVDRWTRAAGIATGPVFRTVDRADQVWGEGIDTKVIWKVVRRRAQACGLENVAPHDFRRYAESRTMPNALVGSALTSQSRQDDSA